MSRRLFVRSLSEDEARALPGLVRGGDDRAMRRAQIVPLSAEGHKVPEMADGWQMGPQGVRAILRRFKAEGPAFAGRQAARRPTAEDHGVCHFEEPCPYWEYEWTAETRVAEPFRGFPSALTRARIPYLPIHADHLDQWADRPAMIITGERPTQVTALPAGPRLPGYRPLDTEGAGGIATNLVIISLINFRPLALIHAISFPGS
jgi:hypothetical protein